jgi:iron(II)-dependent oxidoreductase
MTAALECSVSDTNPFAYHIRLFLPVAIETRSMTTPAVLGQLHALHELTAQLLLSIPAGEAARQFHPELGSLSWHFGLGVYREAHWLRAVLADDRDLTQRVTHLFEPGELSLAEQCAALPPVDHLLNWAAEIRDENLLRLANPGMLPNHPVLQDDRLPLFLVQELARDYERMLMVLNQRSLQSQDLEHRVQNSLRASSPSTAAGEISQGHYRVGARDDAAAYDNELPPQAVELSNYRIALQPVSNAEYLGFMQDGGYSERQWWSDAGWDLVRGRSLDHPEYWRRDPNGHWYQVAVNGAADLSPDEPVSGLSQHEASAYAAWVSARGGELTGAVLQHEYQWEVAARTGALERYGRVQEWCANAFHPYPEFQPFPGYGESEQAYAVEEPSLRSASLHSQKPLRRLSRRDHRPADQRFAFTGLRLVYPSQGQAWESYAQKN